jgi:hypothetical protein
VSRLLQRSLVEDLLGVRLIGGPEAVEKVADEIITAAVFLEREGGYLQVLETARQDPAAARSAIAGSLRRRST